MTDCKLNHWVSESIFIGTQVTFIFGFLTIFFFVYVTKVEKEEFKKQMELIVDNIMDDIDDKLPELVKKQDKISKEQANILANGIINALQKKIKIESECSVKNVMEKKSKVRKSAFSTLVSVCFGLMIASALAIFFGYCIPLKYNIKESLYVVFFVAMTELVFIKVIAANFINADPNKIKRELGNSIQNWIKKNNKIK